MAPSQIQTCWISSAWIGKYSGEFFEIHHLCLSWLYVDYLTMRHCLSVLLEVHIVSAQHDGQTIVTANLQKSCRAPAIKVKPSSLQVQSMVLPPQISFGSTEKTRGLSHKPQWSYAESKVNATFLAGRRVADLHTCHSLQSQIGKSEALDSQCNSLDHIPELLPEASSHSSCGARKICGYHRLHGSHTFVLNVCVNSSGTQQLTCSDIYVSFGNT